MENFITNKKTCMDLEIHEQPVILGKIIEEYVSVENKVEMDVPQDVGEGPGLSRHVSGELVPQVSDGSRQRAGRRWQVLALRHRPREARALPVVPQDHRLRAGAP